MKPSLVSWIADADAMHHVDLFGVTALPLDYERITSRVDSYYIALVGELFDRLRTKEPVGRDWAVLGNGFLELATAAKTPPTIDKEAARLFAASAFSYGGYPASAYVSIRGYSGVDRSETEQACFELLARRPAPRSEIVRSMLGALVSGNMEQIKAAVEGTATAARDALQLGPERWITARLLESLIRRFAVANVRAVLPEGASELWTPLVESLVTRTPPSWEFFPSQIDAISRGLLDREETFSLQMPTSAGKTTLCETLLFSHARRRPDDAAVLLVPYRSLASELRGTVVRRLSEIGITASAAYGGTVPAANETRGLDQLQVLVATPEALSGILSADAEFLRRVSLVICDEGHLLDADARGVSLELLLARLRARPAGVPKTVFISAIVPNIEEINAWLGGNDDTVVRSDYRPAVADYALLRPVGANADTSIGLEMNPQEQDSLRYQIDNFIPAAAFKYLNAETRRLNTYKHTSVRSQAIAAARKALPGGTVAVFAANKRGDQGAIGLAEELQNQLAVGLGLPRPIDSTDLGRVALVVEYLTREFGGEWIGTKTLLSGAVLHHGDIPQEARESLEELIRDGAAKFAICTTTLAEGVNLPIRTLVLYSVRRLGKGGVAKNLLTRDIKNLVGRAGRAGATVKGLVICANEAQWPLVESVARQNPGEPVRGALYQFMRDLQVRLITRNVRLSNEVLESEPSLSTLVDGIDATLIDLASDEIGDEDLLALARKVASATFAARRRDTIVSNLILGAFEYRASAISALRATGRLAWIRETGTRPRLLVSVEEQLLPLVEDWTAIESPTDPRLLRAFLDWSWTQSSVRRAVRESLSLPDEVDVESRRSVIYLLISAWIDGRPFHAIAETVGEIGLDTVLRVYTQVLSFEIQTLVEQGIVLLERILAARGIIMPPSIKMVSEHLRFGVTSRAGRLLAAAGLRHRSAYVTLGDEIAMSPFADSDSDTVFGAARLAFTSARSDWNRRLGDFVAQRTAKDLVIEE